MRLRPSFLQVAWGRWIWASFIPPRRSITVWRGIHEKLPVGNVLQRYGIIGPSACPICLHDSESIDHLFTGCSFACAIWQQLFCAFRISLDNSSGFHSLCHQAMQVSFSPHGSLAHSVYYGNLDDLDRKNRWIFDSPSVQASVALVLLRQISWIPDICTILRMSFLFFVIFSSLGKRAERRALFPSGGNRLPRGGQK